LISLNYRDSRPIYEQVKEGLIRLMTTEAVKPDEKLPSVRELAEKLAINPNTIQRAYKELEAEGYIYSVQAKGSFAADTSVQKKARIAALFKTLRETAAELKRLGLSEAAIIKGLEETEND
jgi:GntR family transcriptional regulator